MGGWVERQKVERGLKGWVWRVYEGHSGYLGRS